MKKVHPVCVMMRELRVACGLSLFEAEQQIGISAIVIGSYERGDRIPPLERAEAVLNGYGYTLVAVARDQEAVRLSGDMATELRLIADQLGRKRDDLQQLSGSAALGA